MSYVDGLNVELYQGINFDSLVATNIEETIDLDNSYDTGDGDEWSIRAQGEIQAYRTGTNYWSTFSDDRVRIWINGELAVNNPTDHPGTYDSVAATGLTSGQWYSIKIEFAEVDEAAYLQLLDRTYRALVPKEQLRFETSAPTFQSAATSTDGTKVVLTYDKALSYEEASDWASATSSTTAATSDFAVTTDGAANAVTAVAVSGSTVELTLTNTVKNDQTVTVAYTDPTSGNDANAVQDNTGNDAASLTSTSVTNNSTVAGTAPTFSSAATNSDGTKVVLTYNEALSSTTAATSTFAVTTDGAANAVTAVAVSGSTVELTLTNTVKNDQAVTVAYTDPSGSNDSNAVQDSAGNDAASLTSTSVTNNSTVAGTAPTFSSAATNSDGTKVVLTYNEALSSTTAATSTFAVTTDGAANAVTAVAVSGSTVELTLTNTVKNDQAVTVAYTDPSGSNDSNAVQDSAGNDAASLTSTSVTNNSTVAGTAPTFSSAATNSDGTKVVLTYNEALSSTTAATSTFAVTTDGAANAVTAVAVSGSTVELTLTNTVKNDQAVTVAYTDPSGSNDSNAVQDSAGNDAASLTSTSVTNNSTVAGTAPTFSSAATNSDGTKVVLTYNEALSSTTAATSTFAVTTDGAANAVTAVAVSGSTVELTITRTIASWQTVTVAYTDPTSGNDANAVQDSAGNDAASLTNTSVTNNSTKKFAQRGSNISGDTSSDFFGRAVSLSNDGTIIAVGASNGAGDGATSGHVQIHAWNSSSSAWEQRGSTINGENNGDLFGEAVAISGDGTIIAIGASKHDKNGVFFGKRHGYVQIYKWNGSAWNQLGSDLEGEARVDLSGASLSLSDDGTIVVIGASSSWETDPDAGSSYPDQYGYSRIYKWDGSSWNQLGADLDGTTDGDQAGEAVAISGDGQTIAVGSFKSDSNGTDAGHTSIYRWNGSAWGALGSDIIGEAAGDEGGGTGLALSEDGTIVAIGAIKNTGGGTGTNTGHTRIFQWNSGTSSWDQLGDDIDGEIAGDLSGRSVALSSNGTLLAIGAIENDGGGSNAGQVRIYQLVSGSWVKSGEDIDGLSANDETGLSISLSENGDTLAVGSGSSANYVRIFELRLDSTAPTFSSAATNSDGTKVVLTYNEALSSTTAAASTFAVTTDGAANAVTAVAVSGSTVELTLTNTVKNDQAVTVAYTDPSGSNDSNAVQDSAGNDAASLTSTSVTNNSTVAGTAPSFSSAATNSDGTKVVLTYNEALSSTTAATSTFAVTTDGAANAVTAVAVSGSTVELTLTNTVKNDQAVTVAYTDPSGSNDSNAVQDSAGNDAASLTSTSVTNNSTVAGTAPSFSSAATNSDGTKVVLTYNEALSSTTAATSTFAVTTDGAANAVTAVAVSGSTVELTLTNTVKNDQAVTVAYTDPSGSNDSNAVQDSAGNDAASLTSTSVTNNSTVAGTAPSFSSAATNSDGTKVVLTYNEALSSTTAATSTFAVTTDGAANAVTAVAVSGSTVELTLTNTVKNDQAVTVAYTDPSGSNDSNAVQDSAGNDAASLTSTSVTNNSTVAGTAPSFSSAATNSDGTKVVLTYNEALSSTTAATSTFAVTTDGSANAVTAVAVSGSTVELTLTNTVKNDQAVTVAYTDPSGSNDSNAVQDSAGNDAASLTSTSVTNNSTVAGTAPTFSSAATNSDGTKVVLTYNEALSSTTAATSTFAVTTDGAANAVTAVAVSGSTVELTLTNTVKNDQAVTVAYTDPSGSNDSNAVQDSAGNDAASLTSTSVTNNSTVAGTAPSFSSAATNSDGTKVVLTYNEALSSTTAATSTFAVTTDGAANAVTAVAISGSTVELTLTNTVKNDQAVTVAYTDPSGSNDSNAVQDSAGNDAASLTSTSVTNNSTVAGTAPSFSSAATNSDGTKVVLTYNEALSSTTAATSTFAVTTDGSANAVTAVAVSGSTVELTLTNTVKNDQAVTVAYTDPSGSDDSNAIQDSAGNDAASLTSTSVTNNSTVAGTAPTFSSAATNSDGTKVVLTYNEALSSTTAATSTFAVTTDGAANAVTAVAISGSTVELTLTNTVKNDQAVTVAYTDPSGSNDSNAVQDSAGNDAASLTSTSVTNNSTVAGTAPTFSSAATNSDGTKVVLTYNEALSSTTAATSTFAVTTDGAANAVTAVAISGSTVELTLTNTVKNDQAVTVAYTDPSGSNDSNAVQDSAGNDAASLTSTSVTNNSTVESKALSCPTNQTTKISLKDIESGYLYGIDDDNQIFEINPQQKTTSKVFDTKLPNPKKSNGVAFHKGTGTLLFFYENKLYSWNTTSKELTEHDFKEGKTASAAVYKDSLWWINSNKLYGLNISALNNGEIIKEKATQYVLNNYAKAGFGDIAITSEGILYGSSTGGAIGKGGFFSFDLQSIADSGKKRVNIFDHGYKQCGKTEWQHEGKTLPIGMQLALSADEQVLYGQTHQNQSASGLDTTGKYFVFRNKDSDGRFTSDIDYSDYQQSHNELDGVGFRDIGGAAPSALGEVGEIQVLSFKGASGAETNGKDINEKLNPYLKYSIEFIEKLKKDQTLTFINQSRGGGSSVEPSDTRLNEQIEFSSGNKILDQQFKHKENSVTVPEGIKAFDMLIDVIDDDRIEGDESLILAIEGYPDLEPAKATIIDNDFECTENLIQNGDFENIETKATRKWWNTNAIPGWALKNDDGEIWTSGFKKIYDATKGNNFYVELDATRKLNALTQTVITEAGSPYTLSFDLHRREDNRDETVLISINDVATTAPTTKEWYTHDYSFIADSDQTTIRFGELKNENDSYGVLIDNVTLIKDCGEPFTAQKITSIQGTDGAEVKNQDAGKDINYGKNDFLTYSFSFDRELEKLQVFDFALEFSTSTAKQADIKKTNKWIFKADGKEYPGLVLYNEQLSIPRGVKTVDIQIPVFDDELIEDEESLSIKVDEKLITAFIKDNEISEAQVERILVSRDNAREFSNWDHKHEGLSISHKDYIAFDIELKKNVNKDSRLNFKQIWSHSGRDANKKDLKLENNSFWVDGKEDKRFKLNGSQLTIPAGVDAFEARLPVNDDKIIEGTEYLTLQAGKEKATARILDNDFVKLATFSGKNGAEIEAFNDDDPNKRLNPYLLYTVGLRKPVRQAQKFNFALSSASTASRDDLDNQQIKFNITKFNSDIPNAKENAIITQKDDGTIWIPIGTKQFTAKLPIKDDALVENIEDLTFSIGDFEATASITDNDFEDANIETFHADNSSGAEKTKGFEKFLTYSLTFDKRLQQQQDFSFSQATLESQANVDHNDVLLGADITFKSDKPSKNNDFLLNNHQLRVPRGVTSFDARIPIVDDTLVEGTESLTLSIAGLDATAYITDNDVEDVNVESFHAAEINGAELTDGLNPYLTYSLTFSEKLKKEQNLTFSQSILPYEANVDQDDVLLGSNISFRSNKPKKNKKFVLNEGLLTIPKGVRSFEARIPIIDDTLVEGTESLTLSIAGEEATATITDNDIDTVEVASFHAADSNGAEQTDGFNNFLSYSLTFNGKLEKDQDLSFSQSKLVNASNVDRDDVLLGANISFSSNEQSKDQDFVLNNGILSVPKGISSFTANIEIVDDELVEDEEFLTLSVAGIEATASIIDNDFDDIAVTSFVGYSGAETNGKDENSKSNPFLKYTISFSKELKKEQTLALLNRQTTAQAANPLSDIRLQEITFESNNNKLDKEFNRTNNEITVPKGVKTFDMFIDVIDDAIVEGDEQLTLYLKGYDNLSATAAIIDNDYETIAIESFNAEQSNGAEQTDGFNNFLSYSVTFNEELKKTQILTFRQSFPDSQINIDQNDVLLDSNISFYSNEPSKNKDFDLNNGVLSVPKGISSFTSNIEIVDDELFEGEEFLTLSVAGFEATASITDNDFPIDQPAQLISISGNTVTEGTDESIIFEYTFDKETPFEQVLQSDFGTKTEDLLTNNKLAITGLDTEPIIKFTADNLVKIGTDRTMTVPKGVNSFSVNIDVIDDNIPELTEQLVSSIGAIEGSATIIDNDSLQPLLTATSVGATEGEDDYMRVNFSFNFERQGGMIIIPEFPDLQEVKSATPNLDFTTNLRLSNNLSFKDQLKKQINLNQDVTDFYIDIPIIDDALIEPTENISLNLIIDDADHTPIVGTIIEADATTTLSIYDNDPINTTEIIHPKVESIDANSVTEGDSNNLGYTVKLDRSTAKETSFAFAISGDAVGATENIANQVDYLIADNVTLTNGVINNGDGSITIPAGVQSFSASVPVIDDSLIENTETAILSIGSFSGIGQIFDNDSLPTQIELSPSIVFIDANAVTEGDSNNLVYTVKLDRSTTKETSFAFAVSGDAVGAPENIPNQVDYLIADNVTLTNGVINNGDGSITIPAGVQSFSASVPVIDDSLIENTETAILSVGSFSGIGQIFDNDSLPTQIEPAPSIVFIDANAVTEGDSNNLVYTVKLDRSTAKETSFAFAVSGDAVGGTLDNTSVAEELRSNKTRRRRQNSTQSVDQSFLRKLRPTEASPAKQVDYLIADNVTLTNGVINNGDGSITIPAGVQSFSASVPVIDDSLIENTETAILSVGSFSGIGQIFDNDSLPTQIEPAPIAKPKLLRINANSALEGANEDLIYRVDFDQRHQTSHKYQFSIGGNASFGLDYLTGREIFITNGVISNEDGSISVPAGIQNFEVHVPVVDDNIIESTEIASILIGTHQGIGQIFDNDSFTTTDKPALDINDKPTSSDKPTPDINDKPTSSDKPTLDISNDNQGLQINGPSGSGLWIQLNVQEGRDEWQNNLILVNSKGKAIGTLGSTPQTHRHPTAVLGNKHLYLEAGETLHFQQQSNNFRRLQTPLLKLSEAESDAIVIALEDGRTDGSDFNDLVIQVKVIKRPKDMKAVETANKQIHTFDGVLNLNWLETDQQLTLETLKNTDADNRIGLVPVNGNRSSGYTIDGVGTNTPKAFRRALRDNLINPDQQTLKGKSISQSWNLSSDEAGLYAPVLITDDNLTFGFGKSTGADGAQHLKVLGENVFGFEDDLARQGSDWHYDDVIVEATLA